MVALPKLLNCCACASLKTGTLIIGSLGLVGSVILLLFFIGIMAGSTALIGLVEQLSEQAISSSEGILIIGAGGLLSGIFSIAICACLVHGARKRNVCLMTPWIGLSASQLVIGIFNILYAFISLDVVYIVCSILGWVLNAYFFLVVWSFKKEIEDEVDAGGDVQKV